MSKYKFNETIYDDEDICSDVSDLLFDLEEQEEIEVSTTVTYNMKGCDGYYSEDEIEDFLETLVTNRVIEAVE